MSCLIQSLLNIFTVGEAVRSTCGNPHENEENEENEEEEGDGGDEEDDDHSEEHELLIGTLLLTITYSRMTFARAVGSLLPCLCLSANPTESAQV